METILGLCIGVGLSAACGFRVFVPLLVMSIATLMGWYEPAKGFEWLAIPAVCAALGFATICEIAAYYVPWVDNLLDTIATPAAVMAGTLSTMAVSSGGSTALATGSVSSSSADSSTIGKSMKIGLEAETTQANLDLIKAQTQKTEAEAQNIAGVDKDLKTSQWELTKQHIVTGKQIGRAHV